jgi:putative DNA primase/helicase
MDMDFPGDDVTYFGRDGRADDIAVFLRLTALDAVAYDRVRKIEAARLGIRVGALDQEVERLRSKTERPPDRPPEFTDEALALRYSTEHADRLRFVASWGRWLLWDGSVWDFDDTLKALDLSRVVCRQASAECNEDSTATSIASAKTVSAIERLAKADRRHAATVDQWDTDPWVLNTPAGIVDLRSGQMHRHRPDAYMTKITAIAPGGDCPLWLAFLIRVTDGDAELIAFLQRMAGYALTGSTREHALFFAYGTGGNGKGVFLNTLTAILGTYAATASIETFTASQSDRHPTDLAMLRGARLVSAQETEQGRRWAESRTKP